MDHRYAIMHMEKRKNPGAISARYNHDYRVRDVINADPDKKDQNKVLVALPQENGEELDYYQAAKKRIEEQDYYKTHKIKSNQVIVEDFIFSFSPGSGVSIDEWAEKTMEWLHENFDKAGDGKSNIISAVLHMDEMDRDYSGSERKTGLDPNVHDSPHIHAMVVPIDERGHLCASSYTDGARTMSELQTSYAESMREFGLERGVEKSSATHQEIRHYHGRINKAVENIKQPRPGQSAQEYYKETKEDIKNAYLAAINRTDVYARQARQEFDRSYNRQMEEIDLYHDQQVRDIEEREEELELKLNEGGQRLAHIEKTSKKVKAETDHLQEESERLKSEISDLSFTREQIAEGIEYRRKLKKGIRESCHSEDEYMQKMSELDMYVKAGEEAEKRDREMEEAYWGDDFSR